MSQVPNEEKDNCSSNSGQQGNSQSESCTESKATVATTFLKEANNLLKLSSDTTKKSEKDARTNEVKFDVKTKSTNIGKRQKGISCNQQLSNVSKIEDSSKMLENRFSEVLEKPSLSFKEIGNNVTILDPQKDNDLEANRIFDQAAAFYEDKREAESHSYRRNPEYAIEWNSAMAMVKETESQFPSKILSRKELDDIPINTPTFNIAKIISDCPSLQRLVDLGVDLSQWEENDTNGDNMEIALRLNFESDVKPRIQWLMDHGIDLERQAIMFTNNPKIFDKSFEEINKSIAYLKSKDFTTRNIKEILIRSDGKWLDYSVVDIDSKLGYFQRNFELIGNEVRQLTILEPCLILWAGVPFQVNMNHITILDGMGFNKDEAKNLLLKCPLIYKCFDGERLQIVFDVVHHTIGLSHETIVKYPYILLQNRIMLKSRHLFLKKLGRNQYDPKKPNFVSPAILCEESDAEFCALSARVPVELYNKFLLTI